MTQAVIYPSTMSGLARYLAKRFGIEEAVARAMVDAVFYDFIYPMVMTHGEKFQITHFGVFRRFWAKSRLNPMTKQMSTAHQAFKFTASRTANGQRIAPPGTLPR